jgi:hypothetical protein
VAAREGRRPDYRRTPVVNGNNDIMMPTLNAFMLSQHIPNAQLIVYPRR